MIHQSKPRIWKEDGKDGILKLLIHGMVFYISDMCLLSFFWCHFILVIRVRDQCFFLGVILY